MKENRIKNQKRFDNIDQLFTKSIQVKKKLN